MARELRAPSIWNRALTECARLSRKGGRERFPIDLELVRVARKCHDVLAQSTCMLWSSAREYGHIEREEELEVKSALLGGFVATGMLASFDSR